MSKSNKAVVIFGEASQETQADIIQGDALESLCDPESIYEATEFTKRLSTQTLPDGSLVSKSFLYKGYELWWMYYDSFFLYFGLPYSRYRRLLEHLKNYEQVDFYNAPARSLFASYLAAHKVEARFLYATSSKAKPSVFPLGVFIQGLITLISLPSLCVKRPNILLFTGDKFEVGKDFDFRMRFVYKALRDKKLRFIEAVRSLEPWKTVIQHAYTRKRSVMYPDPLRFFGRLLSVVTGGRSVVHKKLVAHSDTVKTPEEQFFARVAAEYLPGIYDEIWTIRLNRMFLKLVGVKVVLLTAVMERNFHIFIAAKLNKLPVLGILHGSASFYYNGYDFLPGFTGEKRLSVDRYGVWSHWWKEYYETHSDAYEPNQLVVSGPMRPHPEAVSLEGERSQNLLRSVRVLFTAEQLAVPQEAIPYIEALLESENIDLIFIFRQYRDGFREWLLKHRPDLLRRMNVYTGSLPEAIKTVDVVVGSHTTATLEALFEGKVPIFFHTRKWGDYYNLKGYENDRFFALTPEDLIAKIESSREIPFALLADLRMRYFGDPTQNGSAWLVEEAERVVKGSN